MASPRIGSDELLFIQTDLISVSIKGHTDHIELLKRNNLMNPSELKIHCLDSFRSQVYPGQSYAVEKGESRRASLLVSCDPLFFEHQNYEVVIENDGGAQVEFWHENYHLRNAITPTGRKQSMLSGILNFGNDIGLTDLLVRVDGIDYLRITLEIFPTKLDYREDYHALITDVTGELHGLVFDLLKKTYQNYAQTDRRQSSPVEFFSVIRRIFTDFIRAIDVILARPHHILQVTQEILPSHKIKHINKQTLRWLEKHPDQLKRGQHGYSAAKALAVKKQISYDTRENRLVKMMLLSLVRKLSIFRKQYLLLQRQTDEQVLTQLSEMIGAIDRRLNQSFLAEIQSKETIHSLSLVFSMAAGYRELYKYYLMLTRGLSITGDIFSISTKDIALLYEYWCFIKMGSLLRNKYQLVTQSVLKTEHKGLYVSLTKGARSRMRFYHPETGDKIELSYNPMRTQLPTVPQNPDNILSLEKVGANHAYNYIFDAKYRINPALPGTDYAHISDKPGPELSDINTMHRYRDAIVYGEGYGPYERTMVGAYVLFPYKDEEVYRSHHFYQSIEKVNVGGLPFLPSATSLVEEMLGELIADSPESAFQRVVLPQGLESKLMKVDWQKRDILVVAVRDQEELDHILEHSVCFVSAGYVNILDPLRSVALYLSKKDFQGLSGIQYLGHINHLVSVDIQEEDPTLGRKGHRRLLAKVDAWKKLEEPIKSKEIGFEFFLTNAFLVEHAKEVPELFIRSAEEYRLYRELSRAVDDWVVTRDERDVRFRHGDLVIFLEEESILVLKSGRLIRKYAVKEFMSRPNRIIRDMSTTLF